MSPKPVTDRGKKFWQKHSFDYFFLFLRSCLEFIYELMLVHSSTYAHYLDTSTSSVRAYASLKLCLALKRRDSVALKDKLSIADNSFTETLSS